MTRTKLRTRRDIENENAELRGAVAELRKQVEALQVQAKVIKPPPTLEDIIRELQKLMPPQQPQVIPMPIYPQPQPLPWYPQPTVPIDPWNPIYPWDVRPFGPQYTWCQTITLDGAAVYGNTTGAQSVRGTFKASS